MIYEEILLYHYPNFAENYKKKIETGKSVIDHIIKKNETNQLFDDEDSMEDNF